MEAGVSVLNVLHLCTGHAKLIFYAASNHLKLANA